LRPDKPENQTHSSALTERDYARTERDSAIVERNSARSERDDLKDEAAQSEASVEDTRAAQEHFVATISHDLRTPIGAIKMAVEVLKRREGEDQNIVKLIERNADKADELISHLLDAHLIKSGSKLPIKVQRCNLLSILKTCRRSFAPELKNKISFAFNDQDEVWGVWDALALERAFKNLISNAIKFGDSEKEIKISVTQDTNTTSISFQNFGEPISEKNLLRIFDSHFRAQNSEVKKGWGLGLTIVRGIVEAHHGKIAVESTPTEGTIFTLKLPNDIMS
jgi:signal transduction histidine kinase